VFRPRQFLLALGLLVTAACTPQRRGTRPETTAPTALVPGTPMLRAPEVGLPFHEAGIVDLALLPPAPGEQWRLASGDAEGWVRIWADGELLAVWHAHPRGLAALQMAPDGVWYTAGYDGRILEWQPHELAPARSYALGRPITALAVAGPHLAISDGHYIQLWSRGEQPQLVWSMASYAFVTGLALSASGDTVAAAELRQWALRKGIANHPLAVFEEGPSTPDPDAQAELRALAEYDFPDAQADFIEVWQPAQNRARQLSPHAPIDRDIAVLSRGGVVYREIYQRDNAGMIGRSVDNKAHFALSLTKPWVFWTDAQGKPIEASSGQPNLPVGDFRVGPSEEILVLDLFPGWGAEPPARGWRVGARRELATDRHHAAVGDDQGNLAVVAWARPAEAGWLAAGAERPDLLTAAASTPQLITATLEPRTNYRLWSLDEGRHRSIRVEAPWHVIPNDDQRGADPAAGVPLYPFALATDAEGRMLITSMSSYDAETQAAVRAIRVGDGGAQILSLATTPVGLEIDISPDAMHVLAWAPGAPARSWKAPTATEGWTAGPDALGGVPRFADNGHWSAHVSGFERHIVDLEARKPVLRVEAETITEDIGAGSLVAIADDGTLAVVQPFGAGTLERIALDGTRVSIELPGAATALSWVSTAQGDPVLVVGFQDGSIIRVDGPEGELIPIHAGAGGRIWALSNLGGRPGVYVELDDRGLTLHRLGDDASVELHLGDRTLLARWDGAAVQALRGEDLVAVWRPGSAMPPCRILDGSDAGVIADAAIERWPSERGAEFFAGFFAGNNCEPARSAGDDASTTEPAASDEAGADAVSTSPAAEEGGGDEGGGDEGGADEASGDEGRADEHGEARRPGQDASTPNDARTDESHTPVVKQP
jgi:hypothetical protein